MKNLMRVFFALSMFFAMGCDDDDDNDQDNIMNFSAGLSGTGENPPNASTASGTATAIYNETTNRLSISVPYTGMTATAAHIHKGAVGTSGPPVFPFENLTSPLTLTNVELTQAQEDDLLNGLYYVNIHSADFPVGEIRGQLTED